MAGDRNVNLQDKMSSGVDSVGNEPFDVECLKLINEYFYGVRIFPGQDPSHVYVGWVTTQYHYFSNEFNQTKVRKASITKIDDFNNVKER